MEALVGVLIGINIVQFGLLWYRMGKIEGALSKYNNRDEEADDG